MGEMRKILHGKACLVGTSASTRDRDTEKVGTMEIINGKACLRGTSGFGPFLDHQVYSNTLYQLGEGSASGECGAHLHRYFVKLVESLMAELNVKLVSKC